MEGDNLAEYRAARAEEFEQARDGGQGLLEMDMEGSMLPSSIIPIPPKTDHMSLPTPLRVKAY